MTAQTETVPFDHVVQWAAQRGIRISKPDSLPIVNTKRAQLGLPAFEIVKRDASAQAAGAPKATARAVPAKPPSSPPVAEPSVAADQIAIDKGIPLPPIRTAPKPLVGPYSRMDVGDSFLVQDGNPKRLAAETRKAGKLLGRVFAYRTVPGGVRIWRVS